MTRAVSSMRAIVARLRPRSSTAVSPVPMPSMTGRPPACSAIDPIAPAITAGCRDSGFVTPVPIVMRDVRSATSVSAANTSRKMLCESETQTPA